MPTLSKPITVLITCTAVALAGAMAFLAWKRADDDVTSWKPTAEGFLAVETPCCTSASLWESLDDVRSEGQRARPATAQEVAEWLDQSPPPEHIDWIPDGFKQGYGIHFRMWTKGEVDRIYQDAMERVFVENADMEEILSGLDSEINPAVEYGDCNPYAGVAIPMHGLSLQDVLEKK